MELRTIEFTAPSRNIYEIREQNGEDEDILSNPLEMRTLMHLSRYISAIVVKTTFTKSGKLTVDDALNLPLLDRYCILIKARIFSIGPELNFDYSWGKSVIQYEEDLNKYVFEDYSKVGDDEISNKPDAVPFYIDTDILEGKHFKLKSGKVISFKAATGKTEQRILSLPEDKRTRNAELIARDLSLEVDGKFEIVQNFSRFGVRDMAEIRHIVNIYDPTFTGVTDVTNPSTGETVQFPILAAPSFFFPTEM